MKYIYTLTLLIISEFCFSQNLYPRPILIGADTACLISQYQVKTINILFIDLALCNELKSSLDSQVVTYEKIIRNNDLMVKSLKKQIGIMGEIDVEKNEIIKNYRDMCMDKDKKIKSLKIQRTGLVILSAVLGIIITL